MLSRPRRLAIAGVVAMATGALLNVALVLAGGGGLTGGYYAGLLGSYVFWGCVALIAIGAGISIFPQRSSGLALMLLPAVFEVGYLIGSQISLWILIIPHRT
jgi:hypothetical protein